MIPFGLYWLDKKYIDYKYINKLNNYNFKIALFVLMDSPHKRKDGKWIVPLKMACPKAKTFNNGGTCPDTLNWWVYESCGHYDFIDEEGFCQCINVGCTTSPNFIAHSRFNCNSA